MSEPTDDGLAGRPTHVLQRHGVPKPTPVRLGHVPGWFERRLLESLGTADMHVVRGRVGGDWLDAWGSTEIDSREVFVSEPTSFVEGDARALEQLGRLTGISWRITAYSWFTPGQRIRITFEEPRT
jgi:hypothetical protein